MNVITVTNLGKAYKKYPSRWSRFVEWVVPFSKPRHQVHWVLKNIDFKVSSGEAVGIIGINGAGKSTLLKMITGTAQPNTGSVVINGRVAALLELGMGFHPEFTGRQNAIMAGQMMGFKVEEIQTLMPEIESFAEIGSYIDEPVRVYSSGMQVRLAFAVATAIRPDILIVDEALSVGDAYFQHKSFNRIREYRKLGTSLLIVSHDKGAIQSICDRAILLNEGTIAMQGDPQVIMDYYHAIVTLRQNDSVVKQVQKGSRVETISGNRQVEITQVDLTNQNGDNSEYFDFGSEVTLSVKVKSNADTQRLICGFLIKDRLGQSVYGTNTDLLDCQLFDVKSYEEITYRFIFKMTLGTGTYSISIALASDGAVMNQNFFWLDLAKMFDVGDLRKKSFTGFAWLDTNVEIQR